MARFYPLKVADVRKTIRDAAAVALIPTDGGDFTFTPGQYLTFRRMFDGVEIRRSYSICSGRNEGRLEVGIKRVDGGAFSTWANEHLRPGDVLEAMEPMGAFHTPLNPEAHKQYLGFAGGSGITPLLSILKTTLIEEPHSRFTLVYANRAVNTIMFREELEDLKNRYMGRFNLIHVLEAGAQDIDLFAGRVDDEKCATLFAHWINIADVDTAFICGPEPMMQAISSSLRAHGLLEDQIKFELFASGQPGRAPHKAQSRAAAGAAETEAHATLDGATRGFSMRKDQTLLEAALENDIDAPYACRAGVCSTCKCKVLDGEVEMAANHALEDYEVAQGYVLSCQSYAISDRVVVDYDR